MKLIRKIKRKIKKKKNENERKNEIKNKKNLKNDNNPHHNIVRIFAVTPTIPFETFLSSINGFLWSNRYWWQVASGKMKNLIKTKEKQKHKTKR